jgi:hypothetical protein
VEGVFVWRISPRELTRAANFAEMSRNPDIMTTLNKTISTESLQ